MKGTIKIIAALLAAGSVFSLAGCAGTPLSAKVSTLANWNIRNTVNVESAYASFWQENAEVAMYDVTFAAGNNGTSSVSDNDGGTYTTKFYMQAAYDWNGADIPEAYRSADATEPVYVYETQLSLSGTYTLTATGEKVQFDDSITTVTKFRMAEGNLQPVYSYHDVTSTSPATLNPSSVQDMCAVVDAEYVTYYNRDCTQATVTVKKAGSQDSTESVSLTGDKDYSLFENFQLRAAVRAFNKTGGTSYLFDVFSPEAGNVQTVQATCAEAAQLDANAAEQKKIIDALSAASPYIFVESGTNDDGAARTYRYNAVSLSLEADMGGQNDLLWYAAVENDDVNAARSLLLRVRTPLAFALGTLDYTLSSVSSVKL